MIAWLSPVVCKTALCKSIRQCKTWTSEGPYFLRRPNSKVTQKDLYKCTIHDPEALRQIPRLHVVIRVQSRVTYHYNITNIT